MSRRRRAHLVPQSTELTAHDRRRAWVAHHIRTSARGLAIAGLLTFVVWSGVLPMTAGVASFLLFLAAFLGISRALRGIWAVRVALVLLDGWGARLPMRRQRPPRGNRAAIALLTGDDDDLMVRVRSHANDLVDRMDELDRLLADRTVAPVLRRPLAEERARVEQDLELLMSSVSTVSSSSRPVEDVLERLTARIEVETPLLPGPA